MASSHTINIALDQGSIEPGPIPGQRPAGGIHQLKELNGIAFAPQHLTSREQEELDERRSAGAMMGGRVVDELEGRRAAAMKPGDYAVQVHVIECRDLKAEDLNGLSDPYARVRVHGRQRKTRVVKKVTSCVFDAVLHFSLPLLTTAAAEAAAVDIAILDHDAIGRHATIGSARFDLRQVHALAAPEV